MITCRELAELLLDFIADELTAEQRQRLEEHLRKCTPCVIYMETYQITIRLTRQLPCGDELPEGLRQRCEELLRQEGGCAD